VELVDWDDDDDNDTGDDDDDTGEEEVLLANLGPKFVAPSSEAPTPAGLEAGCAAPPSRASSTSRPGVAAPSARLKSILVRPVAPSTVGK
jgi:hypothetical protein